MTIVYQQADSCSPSIAEYKNRSMEWILVEYVPANSSQAVNAFTEIDKLNTNLLNGIEGYLLGAAELPKNKWVE